MTSGVVGQKSIPHNFETLHAKLGSSVGIDLKELGEGGQLPKCLKFCPGIEI